MKNMWNSVHTGRSYTRRQEVGATVTMFLAITAVGGAALLAAASLAYAFANFGVGFFVVAFLFETFVETNPPIFQLGAISLYLFDLAMITVGAAAIVRMVYLSGRTRLPIAAAALVVFVAIFAISFVRGLVGYDVQAAGVEFRRYLGFLVVAMYIFSFRPDPERRRGFMNWWLLGGALLCGLTLVRWVVAVLEGEPGRLRVVGSRETLFIAQAMLIALHLFLLRDPKPWLRWAAIAFLPFVVLLQHRTVWIVLIVAIVVLAAREGRLRAPLAGLLAFGIIAVALGALLIYGDESTAVLGQSATQGSTFTWRLIGWQALLEQHFADPVTAAFGAPFGAGFLRDLRELGYSVDVSPHNFYITMLLRGGPLALVCFGIMYVYGLARTGRGANQLPEDALGYRTAFVLLLSHLVFFLSYEPWAEQGVILGVALSLAASAPSRRERKELEKHKSPESSIRPEPVVAPALSSSEIWLPGKLPVDDVRRP